MKKLILICLITSFIFGAAQEKKISFTKELNYQFVEKNTPQPALKMYASSQNEFLTRTIFKDIPLYYYTDGLGTTVVSMEMNNRLDGSLNSLMFYGMAGYSDYGEGEKGAYTLETQKLNTKETVLGIPCTHYLLSFDNGEKKDDKMKLCIDEKSTVNNFSVLNGILNQYMGKSKLKSSGLNGMILKAAPEKNYSNEYIILASMKDSKDFVYFDHKKAMTDQQRKMDSIMLAYKKMNEEYASVDSATTAVDSAATAVMDEVYTDTYIPEYVSEYKKLMMRMEVLPSPIFPVKTFGKGCLNIARTLKRTFLNSRIKI